MGILATVELPPYAWTPTQDAASALQEPCRISGHPDDPNVQVIRYDDTTEQGAETRIVVPAGCVSVDFYIWAGALTAPGATEDEVLNFYEQQVDTSGGPNAWGSAVALPAITIPTSKDLVRFTFNKTVGDLGLTADKLHSICLSRDTPGDLADDLALAWVRLVFND